MVRSFFLTEHQRDRKVRPYATELGNIVYFWNGLQESFYNFLWFVTGKGNPSVARAICFSIQSDRVQRAMLKAAVKAAPNTVFEGRSQARDDILWLISKADNLGEQRNDAVHSPYFLSESERVATLVAADFIGNPRSKNLSGKDLMAEFKWYAASARALWVYSTEMQRALLFSEEPWPDRPLLPTLGQKSSRRPRTKGHSK
jgi:hypothetical protein